MFRKIALVLATAAAIGVAVPADALARGHGGGFGGGGFRGGGGFHGSSFRAGGFAMGRMSPGISPRMARPMALGTFAGGGVRTGGWHHANFVQHGRFFHHHRHFRRFAIGFVGPYSYWDYPYDYDDCYQLRRVPTPYGWRWRRVDVCR